QVTDSRRENYRSEAWARAVPEIWSYWRIKIQRDGGQDAAARRRTEFHWRRNRLWREGACQRARARRRQGRRRHYLQPGPVEGWDHGRGHAIEEQVQIRDRRQLHYWIQRDGRHRRARKSQPGSAAH